jgi:hypothetical protein
MILIIFLFKKNSTTRAHFNSYIIGTFQRHVSHYNIGHCYLLVNLTIANVRLKANKIPCIIADDMPNKNTRADVKLPIKSFQSTLSQLLVFIYFF